MNSLVFPLLVMAGVLMVLGYVAWHSVDAEKFVAYMLIMMSFIVYAIDFVIMLFFPYTPQSMIAKSIIGMLAVGMAVAAIVTWMKYKKAYPKEGLR